MPSQQIFAAVDFSASLPEHSRILCRTATALSLCRPRKLLGRIVTSFVVVKLTQNEHWKVWKLAWSAGSLRLSSLPFGQVVSHKTFLQRGTHFYEVFSNFNYDFINRVINKPVLTNLIVRNSQSMSRSFR